MTRSRLLGMVWAIHFVACSSDHLASDGATHSSAMALSTDGTTLFVVNPDADSVAQIDTTHQTLVKEILLAGAHPVVDGSGAYAPAVMPRYLTLSPSGTTVYVSGERSSKVYAIDVASGAVTPSATLCSEPVGIIASSDGQSLFLACSQDNTVLRLNASSLTVTGTVVVASEPWALAWASDGKTLLTSHFLVAQITAIDASTMTAQTPYVVPAADPRGDPRLAHGQPRGLYDVTVRPGTTDMWVTNTLLGVDTSQPTLDFESTDFAALTVLNSDGSFQQTMSVNAQAISGNNGAFADIVSGAHAMAFTHDGAYVLLVNTNSEDVLVVDANAHVESSLMRPLPGHQPEAVALSPKENVAYVLERNTSDVAVLTVTRDSAGMALSVASTIPTVQSDPMPTTLRFGQHLFYSANSDEYPITKNHWVACATCHMEGRSDAVTWLFAQGPRDTPTNAAGMIGTGFLFRTADRTEVQDYWHTVNIEQGGSFDPNVAEVDTLLDAIAAYVNYGIPAPIPPTTDPNLVAQGAIVFQNSGCTTCHAGPRHTDSGSGNPNLALAGPVMLHDVGTCVTTGYPDVAHTDINGDARAACEFDTPALTGVASSPPYFHDGSAATLEEAALIMAGNTNVVVSPNDIPALVEFLKSL